MFGWMTDAALLLVAIFMLFGSIGGFLISGRPRPRVLLIFDLCIICWIIGFWMTLTNQEPVHTAFWQYISLGSMVFTIIAFVMALTDVLRPGEDEY